MVRDSACGSATCKEFLAAVVVRASIIHRESGHLREALEFANADAIVEPLLRADPSNRQLINTMRRVMGNRLSLLMQLGRLQEALVSARSQLSLARQEAAADPWQSELLLNEARAMGDIALVLRRLGRDGEALANLDGALAIADHPSSQFVNWLIAQAAMHGSRAELRLRQADTEGARADFRAAMRAADAYLLQAPGHAYATTLTADTRYAFGQSLLQTDRRNGCELLRDAVGRYRSNPVIDPGIRHYMGSNLEKTVRLLADNCRS